MANNKPIFVGEIYGKNVTLTDTTLTDIFVGDVSLCTRVDVIAITTDEASNQNIRLYFHDGTASRIASTLQIPLGAGTTYNIPPLSVLAHTNMAPHVITDGAGNKFIDLPPGWKIQAQMSVLTGGKNVFVLTRGGTY
jgi:hypothetical protein